MLDLLLNLDSTTDKSKNGFFEDDSFKNSNINTNTLDVVEKNKITTESNSICIPENSEQCESVYNVVYGKQTKKKHKTWEGDGILEVGSKYVTLKDENGVVIGRFLII